jgi:hypothetical protein
MYIFPPEDGHKIETCSGYWIKYWNQCCVRRKPWTWLSTRNRIQTTNFKIINASQAYSISMYIFPHEDCHKTETCSGYCIKYSNQCCVRRKPWTWPSTRNKMQTTNFKILLGRLALSHLRLIRFPFRRPLWLAGITVEVFLSGPTVREYGTNKGTRLLLDWQKLTKITKRGNRGVRIEPETSRIRSRSGNRSMGYVTCCCSATNLV